MTSRPSAIRDGTTARQGNTVELMDSEIQEENRRIRRLRLMVDFSLEYLRTQRITHDEAIRVVEGVRRFALNLFPGKEESFDIIYAPRFRRLLNERFRRS